MSRGAPRRARAAALALCALGLMAQAQPSGESAGLRLRYGFAPGQGHPEPEALPLSRLAEHALLEQNRALFMLPIALNTEPLGVAAISVTSHLARSELLEDLRELFAIVLKVARERHD